MSYTCIILLTVSSHLSLRKDVYHLRGIIRFVALILEVSHIAYGNSVHSMLRSHSRQSFKDCNIGHRNPFRLSLSGVLMVQLHCVLLYRRLPLSVVLKRGVAENK